MVAVRDRFGMVEPCPDELRPEPRSPRHTLPCHTVPDIGLFVRTAADELPNGKSKPACPMSYVFNGR